MFLKGYMDSRAYMDETTLREELWAKSRGSLSAPEANSSKSQC